MTKCIKCGVNEGTVSHNIYKHDSERVSRSKIQVSTYTHKVPVCLDCKRLFENRDIKTRKYAKIRSYRIKVKPDTVGKWIYLDDWIRS